MQRQEPAPGGDAELPQWRADGMIVANEQMKTMFSFALEAFNYRGAVETMNTARIMIAFAVSGLFVGCSANDPSVTPSPMTSECAVAVKETAHRFRELALEEFSPKPNVPNEVQAQSVDHQKRAYWAASDHEIAACASSTNWKRRGTE
jgi:hypothetical protein